MGGGTVVQGRNFVVTPSVVMTTGTSTATAVLLGVLCPATGAEVVQCLATVRTAGTSTTSATIAYQLQNSSGTALCAASSAIAIDTAAGSTIGITAGNGNTAGNAGTQTIISWTEAGTINAGASIDFQVMWAL